MAALRNVSPVAAMKDVAHSAVANMELHGEIDKREPERIGPDVANILLRKQRASGLAAATYRWQNGAPSLPGVSVVVGARTGLKMARINAAPVVASVAHNVGRPLSSVQQIRDSVSAIGSFPGDAEPAVSLAEGSGPVPAIVGPSLVDLLPETSYGPVIHGNHSPVGLGSAGANRCEPNLCSTKVAL